MLTMMLIILIVLICCFWKFLYECDLLFTEKKSFSTSVHMSSPQGLDRNRRKAVFFLSGQPSELAGHRLMKKAASACHDIPVIQSNDSLALHVVTVSCEWAAEAVCGLIWLMDVVYRLGEISVRAYEPDQQGNPR